MSAGVPEQVDDPDRLDAVRRAQLIGEAPSPGVTRLVELAAALLESPLAFFTVVDSERSWYHAAVGIPDGVDSGAVEGSFCKYVIASGEPLVVRDVTADSRTIGNPAIESLGVRAWAGHPVRDPDGVILGSFCVVDTEPRDWSARDIELLGVLAAAADDEVENHRIRLFEAEARTALETGRFELDALRERQHELLALMQRSLLPVKIPDVEGLDLALRYESANTTSGLGGDWYDVITLGDGRTALVIADVAGHDAQAVATMAQLRPSLHAFARDMVEPAAVLTRLHELMVEVGTQRFLTIFYATWEPATARLRFQSAGHPPPIVAPVGKDASICEEGRTTILGSPVSAPTQIEHEMGLGPGDAFIVFTDGLFERRDLDFDAGLRALTRIADAHRDEPVDVIADTLMRESRPTGGWDDDVALLVARRQTRRAGAERGFQPPNRAATGTKR